MMNKKQVKALMGKCGGVLLAVLMLLCVGEISAKDYQQVKVYMFGFAGSFNDSTVYFTEVQTVDDAWVYEKQRSFLVNRDDYSYQLRNYLQREGVEAPTCVTVYAFSEKEINKKYAKLRQRYEGKKSKFSYLVRSLPVGAFAYKGVDPSVGRVIVNPEEAEAAARRTAEADARAQRKAEKKARKAARKGVK